MKQTMLLKLVPTPEQAAALLATLLDTLHAVNAACTYAGEVAFKTKTGNQFALQKLVSSPLRMAYHLPARAARHSGYQQDGGRLQARHAHAAHL